MYLEKTFQINLQPDIDFDVCVSGDDSSPIDSDSVDVVYDEAGLSEKELEDVERIIHEKLPEWIDTLNDMVDGTEEEDWESD